MNATADPISGSGSAAERLVRLKPLSDADQRAVTAADRKVPFSDSSIAIVSRSILRAGSEIDAVAGQNRSAVLHREQRGFELTGEPDGSGWIDQLPRKGLVGKTYTQQSLHCRIYRHLLNPDYIGEIRATR